MGRAGWLGLTPRLARQRLDSALALQGAHEALREAHRSYSIKSELQDTGSASDTLVLFERPGCWRLVACSTAGVTPAVMTALDSRVFW